MKKLSSFLSLAIVATMLVGNASAQGVSVKDTAACTAKHFKMKDADPWKPAANKAVKACRTAGGAKAWNQDACKCVVAGDKLSIYINLLKEQGVTISGLQAERDAAKADAANSKAAADKAVAERDAANKSANQAKKFNYQLMQEMAEDAARQAKKSGEDADEAKRLALLTKDARDLEEARRLLLEASTKATAAEDQLAAARALNDKAEAGLTAKEGNNSARPVIKKNRIEVFPAAQAKVDAAKEAVAKAVEAVKAAGDKANADNASTMSEKDRLARDAAAKAEAERKAREDAERRLAEAQRDFANSQPAATQPAKPIEKGATHGFVSAGISGLMPFQNPFTYRDQQLRGLVSGLGSINMAGGVESGFLRLTLFLDLAPFTGVNFSRDGQGPTVAGLGGIELTFNVVRCPWTDDSLKIGPFIAGVGAHTNSDLVRANVLSFGAVAGAVVRFPLVTIPDYGTFFLVGKAGGGGEWYGTKLPSGKRVNYGAGLGVLSLGFAYEL